MNFLNLPRVLEMKVENILTHLTSLRQVATVYPAEEDVFKWAELTRPEDIKVVIIGQDPYHGPKQATGLAFSVNGGTQIPPSLNNIFNELVRTFGTAHNRPTNGSLIRWAEQGVLLLNSTLTVEKGRPGSHNKLGWQLLTNHIISTISEKLSGCVFMLWGSKAYLKNNLINPSKHLILKAQHPSPLASANTGGFLPRFFGCNHFKLANEYLASHSKEQIVWL